VVNSTQGLPVLPTAKVIITDRIGNNLVCRAMLDNCSFKHFITKACCKKLNLRKIKTYVSIAGLGQSTVAEATQKVNLTLARAWIKILSIK